MNWTKHHGKQHVRLSGNITCAVICLCCGCLFCSSPLLVLVNALEQTSRQIRETTCTDLVNSLMSFLFVPVVHVVQGEVNCHLDITAANCTLLSLVKKDLQDC